MRKIINDPNHVVDEMMQGYVSAYGKYYRKHPEVNAIILKKRKKNKVALVIGGGSGHEPMFSGFVGEGLADAAACGNVFASPDPYTIYQTARAVDQGKGVLFVYGCYAGDNLNFDMAEEKLKEEGVLVAHVRVRDDVASAPRKRYEDRRGIAGDVFVIKIAGAACEADTDFSDVIRVTEKARDATWSVGVATSPASLPGIEKPIFKLEEGYIEYGMGIHGEKGVCRIEWQQADVLVEKMYRQLKEEARLQEGMQVCVLINGLGSTSLMELSVVYRKVWQLMTEQGIVIYDSDIQQYCTTQEMGGFSISILVLDEELKKYYDMPCYSPYYAKNIIVHNKEHTTEKLNIPKRKELVEVFSGTVETKPDKKENVLDADNAKRMLLYVADKIIDNIEYLTEVDSQIGDGDHGIGMLHGMQAVKKRILEMKKEENVYKVFEEAGQAMLLAMGGASGVIFGSMFLEGAKGMDPSKSVSTKAFAQMARRSLEAIQKRGHAQPGDKTMVDAFYPAVEAMEKDTGGTIRHMLLMAEEAAKKGMENTKKYQAKYGRAKSLMERAIGYVDAGAVSVYLIIQGMREFAEDNQID